MPPSAHLSDIDPRWNLRLPFHRQITDIELTGDWKGFFDLVAHRLERVFLYSEPGSGGNPIHFGERLVTESCGKFQFDRARPFHTSIRAFFSASEVASRVEIQLMKDPDVIQANNNLYVTRLRNSHPSPAASLAGMVPNEAEVEKAEKQLQSTKDRHWPRAAAKAYIEMLSVLVDVFRIILTHNDGVVGFRMIRQDVQRFFASCNISYDVAEDGRVIRFKPEPVAQVLRNSAFRTGDNELDGLLTVAREKFFDRNPAVHRESIEKLWDAWERLKTLEPGKDKKGQTDALLGRLSIGPEYRKMIEAEALHLTELGNRFMIRHSETNKVPIREGVEVDYLFHRMFTLVWLLLRETNRVS